MSSKVFIFTGTIAYRERKKWLNCVEMPNNPYSPEAIQKRLTAKSTSSLFDMLTTSNKDFDDDRSVKSEDVFNGKHDEERAEKENKEKRLTVDIVENGMMNGRRSKSPSPRILKDVLAEEVPQYKR